MGEAKREEIKCKMIDIRPKLSTVSLNVNGENSPIKDEDFQIDFLKISYV